LVVRTVVLGPPPAELEALIARRHSLGLDTHDEVWEDEYHMAPAAHGSRAKLDQQLAVLLGPMAEAAGLAMMGPFNLGVPGNFRVPDRGVHRAPADVTWYPTAAAVVEIESVDDETWQKLDFYAAHNVEEILIVSAESCSVRWFRLQDGGYVESDHSALLGPESAGLADRIRWPSPPNEGDQPE
jgi:hypothetical protein